MHPNRHLAFPLAAMTAALVGVYAPAHAEEDEEVSWLTRPTSTVSIGIGHLSDDAPRAGLYSGLGTEGGYGLLDIDIVRRDDDTGTWFRINGRNLGLSSREVRFSHERQGEWGYYIDYSAIPRNEPWTVRTPVTGIGGDVLNIPAGVNAGVVVPLKTEREVFGIGFNRKLGNGFDITLTARNEEKDGARLFARGQTFQFGPEPINSSTRQWEAQLGYTAEKLQLNFGYYGSSYDNAYNALLFTGAPGSASNFNQALPPDNQSHQFSLAGAYAITATTRTNFKLAYGKATQKDTFPFLAGLNPALVGVTGLDGRIDTKQAQWGITSRPIPKLSLLANFRYEDRDDKTPARQYLTVPGATATHTGRNEPRTIKTTAGKLEASYELPYSVRATLGADYLEKERALQEEALFARGSGSVGPVMSRKKTDETTYRFGLRRSMSETLTGSIGYAKMDRGGSPFIPNRQFNATETAFSSLIAPRHLADLDRDLIRLGVNWTPLEKLSIQFDADQTKDTYKNHPSLDQFGLRDGRAENYAIDVSYAFSDEWQGNVWFAKNDATSNQATRTSGGQPWAAKLINDSDSVGIGLRGTPNEKLGVGVDLNYAKYVDKFQQSAITGAAITSPPDVTTRVTSLKLFAKYAVQKNAEVRFDYIYDRYSSNDWTWTNWTYSDGTTLFQDPRQRAQFFGVSYIYRFK